jgi:hypothetical protein
MAVRTDPDGICPLCKRPLDDHDNWLSGKPECKKKG